MVYVVERVSWRVLSTEETAADDFGPDTRAHPDEPGQRERITYQRTDDEGGLPVRAFHDRNAAEAFARALELAHREQTNPFRYGASMAARASLDEPRYRDWLLDAELTPPDHKGEEDPDRVRRTWADWWMKVRGKWTEPHWTALGKALNNALEGRNGWDPGSTTATMAEVEAHMLDVTRLTAEQRQTVRIGMSWVVRHHGYPDRDGERDDDAIEAKWRDWWDENHRDMSPYQRHLVWQGLDKVFFYRVVALEE